MLGIGKGSEIGGISELKTKAEGFLKIKPETGISFEQSKRFLDGLFKDEFDRYDSPDIRNCPIENGHWEEDRGNSKWIPDSDYAPQKANPEGKTWEDILNKYGIDGINFKDGEPIFDKISEGTVKIKDFSPNRDDNFDKADIELAKQRGCSPEEIKEWRQKNGYTWHECKDMKTIQCVPSVIHNNIPHRGGVANAKSLEN